MLAEIAVAAQPGGLDDSATPRFERYPSEATRRDWVEALLAGVGRATGACLSSDEKSLYLCGGPAGVRRAIPIPQDFWFLRLRRGDVPTDRPFLKAR